MSKRIDQLTAHPKSTAAPLPLSSDLVLRDDSLLSDNTRKVSLEDVRGAIFHATDYGAQFDGVTDDTVAIQAAIDAADAVHTSERSSIVVFPPYTAIITDTLILKRGVHIVAQGPKNSAILQWDGTAGGVMMRDDTANLYSQAYAVFILEGINFFAGATTPSVGVQFNGTQDWSHHIRRCWFSGCATGLQYKGGWINVHLRDLRFDGCNDYGIELITAPGQNGSSFSLDGFTYDNANSSGANGFICLNNSVNDISAAGLIEIANARIELNAAPAAHWGIVVTKTGGNPKWAMVQLRNVIYQDVVSTSDDVVFSEATATAPYAVFFQLLNCAFENISAFSYNYNVNIQVPGAGRQVLTVSADGGNPDFATFMDVGAKFHSGADDSTRKPIALRVGSESFDRLWLTAAGQIYRGYGSQNPSCCIFVGNNSPEGVVTGSVGSIFQRTDGGGPGLYVKESGTGNTGWVAK